MTLPEIIARNLYLQRVRAKLTQAELARLSLMSQSTIAHIEAGKKSPSLVTLERLCRVFGIKPIRMFEE